MQEKARRSLPILGVLGGPFHDLVLEFVLSGLSGSFFGGHGVRCCAALAIGSEVLK